MWYGLKHSLYVEKWWTINNVECDEWKGLKKDVFRSSGSNVDK